MTIGQYCLTLIILFGVVSIVNCQPADQEDDAEQAAGEAIKDAWRQKVMVQAPEIFEGMEKFLIDIFNKTEGDQYEAFMKRLTEATEKIQNQAQNAAINEHGPHNSPESSERDEFGIHLGKKFQKTFHDDAKWENYYDYVG